MTTLLHLCKKDFTFAKPWILGTWFALAISNVLPWISPDGRAGEPFMMIRLLAPVVMIFLTSTRIIHCDSFVGTSGFMGTRPLRATTLLRNKLVLIAFVLVLPAVGFALLQAACLRVNLSALEWLLLFIENWLSFSLIAGAAVAYAVISRHVGIMVVLIMATLFLFLMLLAISNLNWPFGESLEEQHLKASFQLVAQAFLSVAAVAIAMSWVALRRIWLTATGFLVCAAFLVAPGLFWKWNFVDEMSQDMRAAEIVANHAEIEWTDAPVFYSHSRSMNNMDYSMVTRPGRITGLKADWTGKLEKFQSEARFKNGTVWKSKGDSKNGAFEDPIPVILQQLGNDITGKRFMRQSVRHLNWPLFEFAKGRLDSASDRQVSICGTGTFELYQPFILAELPAKAEASMAAGRFRFKIESLNVFDEKIYLRLKIREVPLISMGNRTNKAYQMEFLLVNPDTKEFAHASGSGVGSRVGNVDYNVHDT
ncbi:MAG: hypothetical protein ACRDBP_14295, partial [Luteolibacter sp.]